MPASAVWVINVRLVHIGVIDPAAEMELTWFVTQGVTLKHLCGIAMEIGISEELVTGQQEYPWDFAERKSDE
ncbi:hypothetical protein [Peristeroidobacter soli]|uniref:hypothetical protein n=1 Tax=Peristeroidobacter soli TaxID=2497877 RepID=UPI00101D980D|nr:hypothetical protein [Peristeroidobacter soli]